MDARLKTSKKDRPYLEILYDGTIADGNRAIEKAIAERGLDRDKITILAYPRSMEKHHPSVNRRVNHG